MPRNDPFVHFVERVLLPFFPGAELTDADAESSAKDGLVAIGSGFNSIFLKRERQLNWRVEIYRSQPFDKRETSVFRAFHEQWVLFESSLTGDFADQIFPEVQRRLVAQCCMPEARDVFTATIRTLEDWSAQTYEGQRIAFGAGFDVNVDRIGSPTAQELLGQDYAPLLANGIDTIVTFDKSGRAGTWARLPPAIRKFAPLRFGRLAHWTAQQGRAALALNRNGDILVFRDGALEFARRRGRWLFFPHEAAIKALGTHNKKLREAAYASALDASFGHHGACIALIGQRHAKKALARVAPADWIDGSDSPRSLLCKGAVPQRFHDCDRELRLAMLSMDGATLVQSNGRLLAVGAIVNAAGISGRGGRLAAAATLAPHGTSIKVSQDGQISVFAGRNKRGSLPTPRFTLG